MGSGGLWEGESKLEMRRCIPKKGGQWFPRCGNKEDNSEGQGCLFWPDFPQSVFFVPKELGKEIYFGESKWNPNHFPKLLLRVGVFFSLKKLISQANNIFPTLPPPSLVQEGGLNWSTTWKMVYKGFLGNQNGWGTSRMIQFSQIPSVD